MFPLDCVPLIGMIHWGYKHTFQLRCDIRKDGRGGEMLCYGLVTQNTPYSLSITTKLPQIRIKDDKASEYSEAKPRDSPF